MSTVAAEVHVARPAAEVFAYATDPGRFSEWQPDVIEGHLETTSSPRVGDRCVTTRRIGFARRAVASTITEFEPPRRWRIRGLDGPVRAAVTVNVEELEPDRTRLTITIDFTGRGVGRLLVPAVIVPQARREMPRNLALLQSNLEKGALS